MVMKVALLAGPILAAAVLARDDRNTAPPLIAESEEDRACASKGAAFGQARVTVPWKSIRRIDDDVEAWYCVFTGDADSQLAFERNADRVRFALTSRADTVLEGRYQFVVRTSNGREIELRKASIRVVPGGHYSCRMEVCQAFTDPGERVTGVDVRSYTD